MDEIRFLTNLDQVKALADPLRLRILELMTAEPLTTKQAAMRLGEKPTRLYHHVDLLAQAGLIQLVETRRNRGTVEKYYRAAAGQYKLDYGRFEEPEAFPNALRSLQALSQTVFGRPLPAGWALGSPVFIHSRLHLPADKIAALQDQLLHWLEACQAAEDPQSPETVDLTVRFVTLAGTPPESGASR